jgi:hypothetical protein
MSTSVAPLITAPLARLRSWIRRRWRTVCLGLLLFGLISIVAWRVPKRTSYWVRQNGGTVSCDKDRALACDVVDWFALHFGQGVWKHIASVHQTISSARNDGEITWVNLAESPIQSEGLFNLKRLTGLTGAGIHSRQMGPGLEVFRELPSFKNLDITRATTAQLHELKRLPLLNSVSLWNPQEVDIGMEALADLPQLHDLFIGDCGHIAVFMKSMPVLPHLESCVVQNCPGLCSDDLRCLKRLPAIKYLDLVCKTGAIDDTAMEHLSQLENLETLALRIPWKDVTDAGLEKLTTMKSLKKVIVLRHQCTPEQISRLQQAVPNCLLIY